MDMEARSQPAERAAQLSPKVKEYRADLAALRDQHQRQAAAGAGPSSSSAADAARAELGLGGVAEDYSSSAAGQRDRMLAATERMQKTSDRLQQGKQQLAETEVRERARDFFPRSASAPPQRCHHATPAPFPNPQLRTPRNTQNTTTTNKKTTGATVLAELQRQRETIQRSRADLDRAQARLRESESALARMARGWWPFGG
jgi:hypothetical protein